MGSPSLKVRECACSNPYTKTMNLTFVCFWPLRGSLAGVPVSTDDPRKGQRRSSGATKMLFVTQPTGCCSSYPLCVPAFGQAIGGLCPSPSCCSFCTCSCPSGRGLPSASNVFAAVSTPLPPWPIRPKSGEEKSGQEPQEPDQKGWPWLRGLFQRLPSSWLSL